MADYIERDAVLRGGFYHTVDNEVYWQAEDILNVPAADVVPKVAYDQVAWERDVAIEQLREDYGVGLGEKKRADVVERKRGRWEEVYHEGYEMWSYDCPFCDDGFAMKERCTSKPNFCGNCGADMREGDHEAD